MVLMIMQQEENAMFIEKVAQLKFAMFLLLAFLLTWYASVSQVFRDQRNRLATDDSGDALGSQAIAEASVAVCTLHQHLD